MAGMHQASSATPLRHTPLSGESRPFGQKACKFTKKSHSDKILSANFVIFVYTMSQPIVQSAAWTVIEHALRTIALTIV